jgi:hypothetical protein
MMQYSQIDKASERMYAALEIHRSRIDAARSDSDITAADHGLMYSLADSYAQTQSQQVLSIALDIIEEIGGDSGYMWQQFCAAGRFLTVESCVEDLIAQRRGDEAYHEAAIAAIDKAVEALRPRDE